MIPLPIDSVLPEVEAAVRSRRMAVVVCCRGRGKTTRIPPALVACGVLAGEAPNLIMLQPRRVAARAAAVRIAEENGWALGGEVGYHVRFEKRLGANTRIRVLTEGLLNRQLLDDPFLQGVGAVVLDEFHERSIHCDLAISFLRQIRETVREDLILVVMSATLDAEPVAKFLGGDCPIIRSPGRLYEVVVEHRPPSGMELEDRVAREVAEALSHPPAETGDVLVFLPGAKEIMQTQRRIKSGGDLVLPLYGAMPFDEQVNVWRPADRRKVILATNIAETSLTIPGVATVIDSGLSRQAGFDPRRGLDQLTLERISRASAEQRCGRAGRTRAGRCIRLWTAKEHAELEPFTPPEIHRVDLSTTVLALHAWGQNDPRTFPWYEAPPEKTLVAAERLLWLLGALDGPANGKITSLGRRMSELPIHPRLARLLLAAADEGMADAGAHLAARLSEETAPTGGSAMVAARSDLLLQLDHLPPGPVARLKEELSRLVQRSTPKTSPPRGRESLLLKLVLLAYPDRVCRRRGDPERAVMVGGAGLRVARESAVRSAEFFVAVEVRFDDRSAKAEALVRMASAIEPEWLEELFPGSVTVTQTAEFDSARGKVVGATRRWYLDLALSEEPDAAVDGKTAAAVLAAALSAKTAEIFSGDESSAALLARVEFLRKWMPEHPWPAFDGEQLAVALAAACAGKRSVEELKRAALAQFLMAALPYPLDRLLEQHAPAGIVVPSGKRISLRYEPGRPPVLAVRLQELFGWKCTPRLAGGRAAVLLELLGPNYRPVQVTDDLPSFWANTYEQVRKDLRRRYPKHYWPDDPAAAVPRVKK